MADDKVRGKVFKIRCKKCSNVIVVRGVGEVAPEPVVPPVEEEGRVWYLVIREDQVGPIMKEGGWDALLKAMREKAKEVEKVQLK